MFRNAALHDMAKLVVGIAPVTPSSTTPRYISMKGFDRLSIIITVKNATTVTGSAITVKQASAVAGTGEKALSFAKAMRCIDVGAGDTLSEFTVSSDTFTTDSTNSKDLIYVIDIQAADLDRANGFDCVRLGTGNATAATLSAVYVLYPCRSASPVAVSAITD